jgi:hypothetical protein
MKSFEEPYICLFEILAVLSPSRTIDPPQEECPQPAVLRESIGLNFQDRPMINADHC